MDIITLTKRLIGLSKPSDLIDGNNEDLEKIFSGLGWNISKTYTKNPRNGNTIPHYLLRTGTGKKHLALVCHWDVVDYGDHWETQPDQAVEKDGKIFGRGAGDMLSGLALSLLIGKKHKDKFTISLFIDGDEETEANGMRELIKMNDLPIDYVIGAEPTATEKAGDSIRVGRRGRVCGNINFKGEAFHAAYINDTHGANLTKFIMDGGLGTLISKYDNGVDIMPATTVAINRIETSYIGSNTVPPKMTVGFDARISSCWTPETFTEEMKKRLDETGLEYLIEMIDITDPYLTENKDYLEKISEAIKAVTGTDPDMNCSGGTSDCRFFGKMGIPTVEIGVENSSIHKPNENVSIENLILIEKIYDSVFENL